MGKEKSRFCRPDAGEQEILNGLVIRLITLEETEKFNGMVAEHHYLKSSVLVGEHMRYAATFEGEWLALGAWSAAALHLKGRDQWIGWSDEQRHRRLRTHRSRTGRLSLGPSDRFSDPPGFAQGQDGQRQEKPGNRASSHQPECTAGQRRGSQENQTRLLGHRKQAPLPTGKIRKTSPGRALRGGIRTGH